MTSPYLTAKQAAEHYNLTYRAFDQAVRRHGIPCVRIGRQRRFQIDQLDRAMRAMSLRSYAQGRQGRTA